MENPESATDLLVAVADRMREYGDGLDVLVIWNTREGAYHIKSNCNYTRALGLAMFGVAECEDSLMSARGGIIDDDGTDHPR